MRRSKATVEWHVRIAKRCRAFGMILTEIAEGLGTSYNTVYRDVVDDRKEYDRLYREKNQKPCAEWRYRILQRYKQMIGCNDCGYDANGVALQFDHLPGCDKRFDVSKSMMRNFMDILDEIDKCQVVCANCHSIRTYNRRN